MRNNHHFNQYLPPRLLHIHLTHISTRLRFFPARQKHPKLQSQSEFKTHIRLVPCVYRKDLQANYLHVRVAYSRHVILFPVCKDSETFAGTSPQKLQSFKLIQLECSKALPKSSGGKKQNCFYQTSLTRTFSIFLRVPGKYLIHVR